MSVNRSKVHITAFHAVLHELEQLSSPLFQAAKYSNLQKRLDCSFHASGTVVAAQRVCRLLTPEYPGFPRYKAPERPTPIEEHTMTNLASDEFHKKPNNLVVNEKTQLTREEQLSKLLCRRSGATLVQVQKKFGWQPHTARAVISRLRSGGTTVERTSSAKGSVYRIATAGTAK